MDYLIYSNKEHEAEIEGLVSGKICALARGAVGRRMPFLNLRPGDMVYLAVDAQGSRGGRPQVIARAIVKDSVRSDGRGYDGAAVFAGLREKLGFGLREVKVWQAKKHVQVVEFGQASRVLPFEIDAPAGADRGWVPVEYINKIRMA